MTLGKMGSTASPKDFRELRQLFENANQLFENATYDRTGIEELKSLYAEYFNGKRFGGIKRTKSRPEFDSETYPSLLFELPIHLPPWNEIDLPADWSTKEIRSALEKRSNDPLIRLLLAFVWKQGDFKTVSHLLRGLKAAGDTEMPKGGGVVMWQFGRHLADPKTEPIFDQHTSRAHMLLTRLDHWKDSNNFLTAFGGQDGIPTVDSNLNDVERLKSYKRWWRSTVQDRCTANEHEQLEAVFFFDRLMFSMGKAAHGIRTSKYA